MVRCSVRWREGTLVTVLSEVGNRADRSPEAPGLVTPGQVLREGVAGMGGRGRFITRQSRKRRAPSSHRQTSEG